MLTPDENAGLTAAPLPALLYAASGLRFRKSQERELGKRSTKGACANN